MANPLFGDKIPVGAKGMVRFPEHEFNEFKQSMTDNPWRRFDSCNQLFLGFYELDKQLSTTHHHGILRLALEQILENKAASIIQFTKPASNLQKQTLLTEFLDCFEQSFDPTTFDFYDVLNECLNSSLVATTRKTSLFEIIAPPSLQAQTALYQEIREASVFDAKIASSNITEFILGQRNSESAKSTSIFNHAFTKLVVQNFKAKPFGRELNIDTEDIVFERKDPLGQVRSIGSKLALLHLVDQGKTRCGAEGDFEPAARGIWRKASNGNRGFNANGMMLMPEWTAKSGRLLYKPCVDCAQFAHFHASTEEQWETLDFISALERQKIMEPARTIVEKDLVSQFVDMPTRRRTNRLVQEAFHESILEWFGATLAYLGKTDKQRVWMVLTDCKTPIKGELPEITSELVKDLFKLYGDADIKLRDKAREIIGFK